MARGTRRREQQRAAALRCVIENEFEILGEPHVEHFIRFVEDDSLQVAQIDHPTGHMVSETAGRGDNDMGAALDRPAFGPGIHAPDSGRGDDPGLRE